MVLKYFTESNSATGYVNIQAENLVGINQIYHLDSPDNRLVAQLLSALLLSLQSRKFQPELIFSTFNPQLLAGIVIRELSVAFTSGNEVPQNAQVITLSDLYDGLKIKKKQAQIDELRLLMDASYQKMTMHLNAALLIHDEWENIYIDRLDFAKANQFQTDFLARLFGDGVVASNGRSQVVGRFFGTSTPTGLVDFIPELTAGLRRFLIKGRPGSGKSTLMRAVLAQAVELGYDADIYYCSLDVKSLDMIVIPELNICLFDATAPHEYEPSFLTDEVIDTYELFIKPTTDERLASVISGISTKYQNQIKQAQAAMRAGHEIRIQINTLYEQALIDDRYDAMITTLVSLV